MLHRSGVLSALLLMVPANVDAKQVSIPAVGRADAAGPAVAALSGASCERFIPALSRVVLVLDADLGSKISKTGDTFPFHLAQPIIIDGVEIVPAGTQGQGEVIHAKKAGGSGTAGELVLSARYLTIGSRQLRLRSMQVATKVSDATRKIGAFNAATAMSPVPVALIGFMVTGSNSLLPKGTRAVAKTAERFEVVPAAGRGSTECSAQRPAFAPKCAQPKERQDEEGCDNGGAHTAGRNHASVPGTGR